MSDPTPNRDDAGALASTTSAEELARLKLAEEVLRLKKERTAAPNRWAAFSQLAVALVAVGGMLVNAYQGLENKQQQEQQRKIDQERWNKEFARAQRADKYRAFFETSVLATDPSNPDKRLVGYALLEEFVDDDDYNDKATLMLEESLAQELRQNKADGLTGAGRNAVVAIVTALSHSSDCKALERASRSIERVAQRHAAVQDDEETAEVFRIYVRRVLGHAAVACKSMKELQAVRRPIVEALARLPEILGAQGKFKPVEANMWVAHLLVETCSAEADTSGTTECGNILSHYMSLCSAPGKTPLSADEQPACELIKTVAPGFVPPPAAASATE
jgi:hypothetical protein